MELAAGWARAARPALGADNDKMQQKAIISAYTLHIDMPATMRPAEWTAPDERIGFAQVLGHSAMLGKWRGRQGVWEQGCALPYALLCGNAGGEGCTMADEWQMIQEENYNQERGVGSSVSVGGAVIAVVVVLLIYVVVRAWASRERKTARRPPDTPF